MDELIGRASLSALTDSRGNLIVKEGEIITLGVIDAARAAGRLEDLRAQAGPRITPAGEYVEIGEENPTGVHPE
ncbi:MAG: hypothetical protein ACYC2Y_08780 [Armatimonadota bacterium]